MPGIRCAVAGCNNSFVDCKKTGRDLSFFRFPSHKDFVSSTIREEWIKRCHKSKTFNAENHRVCSVHFTETDFERDLENELLGGVQKITIGQLGDYNNQYVSIGQFFCIFMKNSSGMTKLKIYSSTGVQKYVSHLSLYFCFHNTENYQNLLKNGKPLRKFLKKTAVPTLCLPINVPSTSNATPMPPLVESSNIPFEEHSEAPDYKTLYEELSVKYGTLNQRFLEHKKKSLLRIKKLNDTIKYWKNKSFSNKSVNRKDVGTNLLKEIFSKNQVEILLNKKKRVNWSKEEIAVAFTLRYYSKKCYLFIKEKMKYPLPALSSLRRWASQINMSQGVLHDILLMMKLQGESFSNWERTVVLAFDEIKLKTVEEYNPATEEILGPHKNMQVVMARGLFSNWKQPVYLAFDQTMTKEILNELILKLHNISYNVVGIVSDCGGGNVGLWGKLNVDINNTSFKHPATNNNIYVFGDAPHLLKLIRNWLLDTGFQLEDGTLITKEPLIALVDLTNTEVNACYKIKKKHLEVEKVQRQNVRLAAQLLSNTTATALLHYKPGANKKMAEELGNFIYLINIWFDIFNSYISKGTIPSKDAFGINLNTQIEYLDKVYDLILNLKAIGKNTLQIFQKGMLISIKSLKNLYNDLKENLGITYICTHKLNQDCLENFFFQIRSRGPNEHPTPLTAIYRMRMIILGKNPGILDANVNTEASKEEEYIVPKVLAASKINVPSETLNYSDNQGSSFSSSGTGNSMFERSIEILTMEETSNDALEYIAGYLAKKYKDTLPNLGDFTYKIKSDHSYVIPSWVQQLSYGGLIKPTSEWLNTIVKWNKYFEKHHGNSFRKGPGIVKNLANKILKKEEFPFKIIYDFCKLRTIIRLNFRNLQTEETKKNTLKRKSAEKSDSQRAKMRKLNKIVH